MEKTFSSPPSTFLANGGQCASVSAPRTAAAQLLARHQHELLREFLRSLLGLNARLLKRRRHSRLHWVVRQRRLRLAAQR
jgi:hypothetical protein